MLSAMRCSTVRSGRLLMSDSTAVRFSLISRKKSCKRVLARASSSHVAIPLVDGAAIDALASGGEWWSMLMGVVVLVTFGNPSHFRKWLSHRPAVSRASVSVSSYPLRATCRRHVALRDSWSSGTGWLMMAMTPQPGTLKAVCGSPDWVRTTTGAPEGFIDARLRMTGGLCVPLVSTASVVQSLAAARNRERSLKATTLSLVVPFSL
mmetsp:Transcript_15926/g.37990  ORF Transcript_15926/g.37990 Transcript_15926/m.37990 type:complete len:207 (-) Transcript_15926:895-1515(-)